MVDDHPVFQSGIVAFLATQRDMNLAAEASNELEAIRQFRQHRPDIILMDLQTLEMNGLDTMDAILVESPETRIIILTTFASDSQDAMKRGAKAFLLKAHLDKELWGQYPASTAGYSA